MMILSRSYLSWMGILLGLAILSSFSLRINLFKQSTASDATSRPDAKATNVRFMATNETGNMHYTIEAQEFIHYTEHNRSLFSKPVITILQNSPQKNWVIIAERGEALSTRNIIHLNGHVNASQAETTITTDYITIHPQQGWAETDAHVTLTTPATYLEADGLRAHFKGKQIMLQHHVRGLYVPKPNI